MEGVGGEEELWFVCHVCRCVFPDKKLLTNHQKLLHASQHSSDMGSNLMRNQGASTIKKGPPSMVNKMRKTTGGPRISSRKLKPLKKIIIPSNHPLSGRGQESNSTERMTPIKIFRNANEALKELRAVQEIVQISLNSFNKMATQSKSPAIILIQNLPITREQAERAFGMTTNKEVSHLNPTNEITAPSGDSTSTTLQQNGGNSIPLKGVKTLCKHCKSEFENILQLVSHGLTCKAPPPPSLKKVNVTVNVFKGKKMKMVQKVLPQPKAPPLPHPPPIKIEGRNMKTEKLSKFEWQRTQCSFCPQTFFDYRDCCAHEYRDHSTSTDRKPFRCQFCPLSFFDSNARLRHERNCRKIVKSEFKGSRVKIQQMREPEIKSESSSVKILNKMLRKKKMLRKYFVNRMFEGIAILVCKYCSKIFDDSAPAFCHAEDHEQNLGLGRGKVTKRKNSLEDEPVANGSQMGEEPRNKKKEAETVVYDEKEYEDTVYCICRKSARGEMVACENEKCEMEWFHYECVGIAVKPKGRWYCSLCEPKKEPKTKKNCWINKIAEKV